MSSPAPIDSEAKAALQKVLDDPVGSVELASQPDKRDELLINALVVGVAETRLWPQFREAGVARLFVQLLVDGWRQGGQKDEHESKPEWHLPLSGLINIMATIKKVESGGKTDPAHESTIATLRAGYPRIVTVIWEGRSDIVDQDVISLLSLAIYHFSRLPNISINDEASSHFTMGIMAHCWLHADTVAARRIACVLVQSLLLGKNTPLYALENALKIASPEAIAAKLRKVLSDDSITSVPSQVGIELIAADGFVDIRHPSAPKFAELGIQDFVVQMLHVQLQNEQDDEEAKWTEINQAAPFLNNVVNASSDPAKVLTDLVVKSAYLELATTALVMAADRRDAHDSAWFTIFKMMIHTVRCKDTTCRIQSNEAYVQGCRTHLAPVYIPTLTEIDKFIGISHTAGSDPGPSLWQVTLSWRAFATALGFKEEIFRADPKNAITQKIEGICWWAKCDKVAPAGTSTKRCSICKAVTYCSEEHQKLDWKEGAHRQVCAIVSRA